MENPDPQENQKGAEYQSKPHPFEIAIAIFVFGQVLIAGLVASGKIEVPSVLVIAAAFGVFFALLIISAIVSKALNKKR